MALGDEIYLKGDSNRDKSVRLIEVAESSDPALPNDALQKLVDGLWRNVELANAVTEASDASEAAAAAQVAAAAAQDSADDAAIAATAAQATATAAAAAAAAAQGTADSATVLASGLPNLYDTTAAALADVGLAVNALFAVPSGATLEIRRKDSTEASTLRLTLPDITLPAALKERLDLVQEIANAIDLTDSTERGAVVLTTVTNPATRHTDVVDGSYWKITQTQASILAIGLQTALAWTANATYDVEAAFESPTSAAGVYLGIGTDGTTFSPTEGCLIGVRQNGAIAVLRGDANTAYSGATVSAHALPTFGNGTVVKLRIVVGANLSTASVITYRDGVQGQTATLTGLPVSASAIGPMLRNSGNPVVGRIRAFRKALTRTDIFARSFFIHGAASPGGNGTEASPFETIADGLASSDEKPGELLRLNLRGGIYRGGLQRLNKSFREVIITGAKSEDVVLKCSTTLTDGWTKTVGRTNIYERPLVMDGVTGALSGNGGIIDATNAYTLNAGIGALAADTVPSLRAGIVLPYTIYNRMGPYNSGTASAGLLAMDAVTNGGVYANDLTAGIQYVHCLAHADPNDLTLERCDNTYGIDLAWSDAADMNFARVTVENVRVRFPYSTAFRFNRASVHLVNCEAEASATGNGFNVDNCDGVAMGCKAFNVWNDAFHADMVELSSWDRKSRFTFDDCHGSNCIVGDAWSNHYGQVFTLRNCSANYNGKSGTAPIDDFFAYNSQFLGNLYGYISSTDQAEVLKHEFYNCDIVGAWIGLALGVGIVDSGVALLMQGGRLGTTSSRRLSAATAGTGVLTSSSITLRNVRVVGSNAADNTGALTPVIASESFITS